MKRESISFKAYHPDFYVWKEMRRRCRAKHRREYASYGKKGITFVPEWNDFWVFITDMGPRPTDEHSIDRIDNYKGYSKDNCRWATRQQQTDNRRIQHECLKGHKWTEESVLWVKNKFRKAKTRRCKICLKKYQEARRKK